MKRFLSRFSDLEVLVSFKSTKRLVTLQSGSTLEELRERFTQVFRDLIPLDTMETDFVYQWFHPQFQEYIELCEEQKLSNGFKVRVQLSDGTEDPKKTDDPVVAHPLVDRMHYKLWSLVSRVGKGAVITRNDSNLIKCNGSVNAADKHGHVLITAQYAGKTNMGTSLYRLAFVDDQSGYQYVVTGRKGENATWDIYLQKVETGKTPLEDKESKFEPMYYFAFTRFRCDDIDGRIDLYLGSDESGTVTLVKGEPRKYPDPSTLFICNQII